VKIKLNCVCSRYAVVAADYNSENIEIGTHLSKLSSMLHAITRDAKLILIVMNVNEKFLY